MPPKSSKLVAFHQFLDVLATGIAFVGAYYIKQNLFYPLGGLTTTPNYYIVLLLSIIIWHAVFSILDVALTYGQRVGWLVFYSLLKGVTISFTILVLCIFLFKLQEISRILLGIFYLLDLGLLLAGRWFIYRMLYSHKDQEYFSRRFLIVGSKQTAKEIIHTLFQNHKENARILGCLETDPAQVGKIVQGEIRVIGTLADLCRIIEQEAVDEVLITMGLNEIENAEWYLSFIDTYGITTRIIPPWYLRKFMASRPTFHTMQFEEFLSESALVLSTRFQKSEELLFKRAFDLVAASLGLILCSPFFPLIAAAIKLASAGPVFYRQYRCGLHGRRFHVLKFRTMVPNAEARLKELLPYNEASGAVFKMKKDPRIIPYVGHFLRKTSLDELPQLLNVLRGEMSIVGPRPPIPEEVEKYELWQRRRLSMKPGITCTWQIQSQRHDVSFDVWMDMDLQYVDAWSLWLDFKIIWQTIPVVLFGRGR